MTEAEWFASDDFWQVVWHAGPRLIERRVRLMCCAFARCVAHLALDVRTCKALELAERCTEGQVSEAGRKAGRRNIQQLRFSLEPRSSRRANSAVYYALGRGNTTDLRGAAASALEATGSSAAERSRQVMIVRDIVGNPFRPVAFDPSWRSDTAVSLANGMYESRDFSAMPILADALQDAGCENDDILTHCRDPQQVHVRGCWVVDLVLGKA